MPNSLGTLGEFEVLPAKPGEKVGMRYADGTEGGNRPAPPVKVGPPSEEERVQAQQKFVPPPPERMSVERRAEVFRDAEKSLARAEKARGRGAVPAELIQEIRNFVGVLLTEAVFAERIKAKAVLLSLWNKRWMRLATRDHLDRFETVCLMRAKVSELTLAKETEVIDVARKFLEELKAYDWPKQISEAVSSESEIN
jgi:hypothetical protein